MATGFWLSDGVNVVDSKGSMLIHPIASNNVAEYMGVIRCMTAAHERGVKRLTMTMDSLLVVSQIKGVWSCQSSHLQELLRQARSLADAFDYFILIHTYREDNSAADALCNFAFDGLQPRNNDWSSIMHELNWKHDLELIKYWLSKTPLLENLAEVWALVQQELRSIGPMIRDMWTPSVPSFDVPHQPIEEITVIKVKEKPLGMEPTWPYVFGPEGLVEMKRLTAEGGLPWDPSRFKILNGTVNKHGVTIYQYPTLDAAYATLILSCIDWNLERLILAWRGQTAEDMRPNKKLDFERLKGATGGYKDQAALQSLIESGYQLHWKSTYLGPRPLPKNHQSAEINAEIMGAQILKHYHSGRLLMLNANEVAAHVPGFTTSPYACVPKAHSPLTHTCRPIHDQSSPEHASVNDNLDPLLRPNAQWPASRAIADRMLTASALYGPSVLYGFNTDIADAFLNIGLSARDVPINGGLLPASNLAALATTAIFGNCESPGAFKILNCVSHVHGSKASYIGTDNTPFDVRFYVDDGNCIEPNIGSRLLDAESSLRSATELVFGSDCIQESKTTPWSKVFTSLGFEWNLHDGTVSIPKEKLERVRECLLEFSTKKTASVSDFRSIVGKLRHVSTVCPPAKALMHLLGLKLHSSHHISGRQHRPVTPDMRLELQWWAHHLTPATFYKLPVEWMGTSLPPVDQWIHVYTKTSVGVWLVDFHSVASSFQPWTTSLEHTLVTAIEQQLDEKAVRHQRMFHTRFLLNECGIARMLNSGSSSNSDLHLALKKSGLWQLQHHHRFTATSTRWENMPELIFNPCPSHSSNLTNFLSSQILWTTRSAAPSPSLLINGSSLPSVKERSKRTARISATGSHSRFPLNFPPSSSTSCLPLTNPRSWRGLQSHAVNTGIIPKMKATSSQHTRSRNPPLSGLTNTIAIPFSNSPVQRCLSLKPVIAELSTSLTRSNPFMHRCCPAALPNSDFGPRPKGNWRGGVFCYSSSTWDGQEKSGILEVKLNTPRRLPTSTLNHDQIIVSKSVTWPSRTNSESTSRSVNIIVPSRSPSPLITQKLIRWDEATQSRWERLDTDLSAQLKALSWPYAVEQPGNQLIKTTPSQEGSKHRKSPRSSKRRQVCMERTPQITPYIQSESGMLQCSLKLDTTSSSFASPVVGQVKSSPYTPVYPVACC